MIFVSFDGKIKKKKKSFRSIQNWILKFIFNFSSQRNLLIISRIMRYPKISTPNIQELFPEFSNKKTRYDFRITRWKNKKKEIIQNHLEADNLSLIFLLKRTYLLRYYLEKMNREFENYEIFADLSCMYFDYDS